MLQAATSVWTFALELYANALTGAAFDGVLAARAAARAAPTIGETCGFTNTVANHFPTRPYMQSPTVLNWIMQAGKPIADPGGIPGALRWDVLGAVNGKAGVWELVYNPANNTVYHWLFKKF